MEKKQTQKCPECGCTEIGVGKWNGYAVLKPVNKFSISGSAVFAEVCARCGLIVNLRVEKPEKFRSN